MYEEDLEDLNLFLSMFLSIGDEFRTLFFVDLKQFQEFYPLEDINEFFRFPPFYVKLLTYDKINEFYCNIIRII